MGRIGSEDKKDIVPDKKDTPKKGVAGPDSIQRIPGLRGHDEDQMEEQGLCVGLSSRR